ncbi:MAG TPA: alpha/beta fold hydrolase [Falsiroseomonas sp.]|jgi:pimeloyl-ACP methyl ester carboxylesterase|nr:alpha/beta fold hydrolase [Falsiroseomonas sp.]
MSQPVTGIEHWTNKGDVRLFLWEKFTGEPSDGNPIGKRGTILFIHGSSMASQPTFDLRVPGLPDVAVMDVFARAGYDCWCLDNEGYGRSSKHRDITCDISNGADDIRCAADYIEATRKAGPLLVYGISSGALKAALFAERNPGRVARLALDAFVWTGEGSPTLEQRRRKLPEYRAAGNRRPIDRAFVHSIFTRDHPGTADDRVVDAFAEAITALDDSVPIGTYIDMCLHLPVVDPKKITCPTIVMRGQYDGIAGTEDLLEFFRLLPNPDKQFAVMPGIAHASFQQKNYRLVQHILASFFAQPEAVYLGPAEEH